MFSILLVFYVTVFVSGYTPLSDDFLKSVPSGGADFDIDTGKLLAPILLPRVPGSPGQAKVQHHFANYFQNELPKWSLEWQNSTSTTPTSGNSKVQFSNMIFKREPPWTKPGQANFLTLTAHYDSRSIPNGFIGATDSAVSCAILMHIARSIDKYMTQMHDEMDALGEGGEVAMDMGVQILLLDGRESFAKETDADSFYGSRALAKIWDASANTVMTPYPNTISQISLFVLLDLLGAADPVVLSYSLTTHWVYRHMSRIESRMRKLGLLETNPKSPYFPESGQFRTNVGLVNDDHVPFMDRGVPTLHIIPSSLTPVWHTMADDGQHLDMPTVRNWAKIMTAFTYEWLDMMEVWPGE